MRIFKTGSYAWWQIGILKLALLSIGAAIGANWPSVFAPYTAWLIGLGVVLGAYTAYVWVNQ